MQILEIQYQIFKYFYPKLIFAEQDLEKKARAKIHKDFDEKEKKKKLISFMRHSKFGTQIGVTRPDGSRAIVSNLYQSNIDKTNLEGHQKKKPKTAGFRGKKSEYRIEAQRPIVEISSMDSTDRKLLSII